MGTAVNHWCSHHEVLSHICSCFGSSLCYPHSSKVCPLQTGLHEDSRMGENRFRRKEIEPKGAKNDIHIQRRLLPRADCGVPGFKLEDHERIVGGVEARP